MMTFNSFNIAASKLLAFSVFENLILHIFLIIKRCSGMFRDVPGCSGMFRNIPYSGFYRRPTGSHETKSQNYRKQSYTAIIIQLE